MANYKMNKAYAVLVSALVNVERCPVTGVIDESDIKNILGEIGDIWPMSILQDAESAPVVLLR